MGIRRTVPDECDGRYYFDTRAAAAACDFFPRYLRLFEGEWAGQPFTLMDWQKQIVSDIFGWKRTKDGTRRYRTAYVWIPRKNTKSTTAAGIALLLLFGDGEAGGQVYTIASTEDQARIVFNFAGQMLAQSPELSKLVTPFADSIFCHQLGAVLKPLTGKARGKHGLNASGLIGDEIHEWPSDDLFTFVHQSEGTRRQPMDFLISTAGKRDGVGWEHFKLCEAILNREVLSEDTYVFIAAADAARDAKDPLYWTTEEAVREANPGLGTTVKLDFLMGEIEKARTNPRKVNDVKRYFLDLWVDQAELWLPMDKFDACGHPQWDWTPASARAGFPVIYRAHDANMRWRNLAQANVGRKCYAGIDLSSTTDLTNTTYVFPPDENIPLWIIIPRFFLPLIDDARLRERIKRDAFDYESAAKVGALQLTEGEVVDYDAVYNDIVLHSQMFDIQKIGLDRWNATGMASRLMGMEGFEEKVVMFGQGYGSMSGPSKFLERKVLQKHIDHGGHPVLRWNARNVAVTKDAAENIKPAKDKSTNRIDGIVGTIIGIGVGDEYTNDGPSVYENRGLADAE